MPGLELVEVLTLFAIVVGPVISVLISKGLEAYKLEQDRKLEVFRTLMKTRDMGISYEHVSALNLVQVEFFSDRKVIKSWKEYLKDLSQPPLSRNLTEEEMNFKVDQRRKKLASLLYNMASALNYKYDKIELFENNYVPQIWNDDESKQRYLRTLLLNVFSGKSSLPVSLKGIDSNRDHNPYPPRPQ